MKAGESVTFTELNNEVDKLRAMVGELERQIGELSQRTPEDRATIVMFSGDERK